MRAKASLLRLAAAPMLALACAAASVAAAPARADTLRPAQPEAASGHRERRAVQAHRYMAVTAHPQASRAAFEVLAAGGSAVDAAIAAQMVLTLVEPQSSGIGGGGLLLHYDARERSVRAYDGRETAPAGADADLFLDSDGAPLAFFDAAVGGRAVGVPGLVRMLELAHAFSTTRASSIPTPPTWRKA